MFNCKSFFPSIGINTLKPSIKTGEKFYGVAVFLKVLFTKWNAFSGYAGTIRKTDCKSALYQILSTYVAEYEKRNGRFVITTFR